MSKIIHQNSALPEVGFFRLPQILKLIPIGKSTWWAGVKNGKYPKPIKLSKRCTAWKIEDIHKLIASYDKKEELA